MAHSHRDEPQLPPGEAAGEIDVAGLLQLWHRHAEKIRGALFRIVLVVVVASFGLFEVSPKFMSTLR